MSEPRCANGCDAPICPPSQVICLACMDAIRAAFQAEIDYRLKPRSYRLTQPAAPPAPGEEPRG